MSSSVATFTGVVLEGEKRGRTLGFPTANIPLSRDDIAGVYAGKVVFGGKEYMAAVFADQKRKLLESYLIDFDGDMYGQTISVSLISRIRERMVFTDNVALTDQIEKDVEEVRELFRKSC